MQAQTIGVAIVLPASTRTSAKGVSCRPPCYSGGKCMPAKLDILVHTMSEFNDASHSPELLPHLLHDTVQDVILQNEGAESFQEVQPIIQVV